LGKKSNYIAAINTKSNVKKSPNFSQKSRLQVVQVVVMTAPEAGDGRVGWGKAPAFVIEAVTPIGFLLRTRQVPSLWFDLRHRSLSNDPWD
jgi:hypothetical protein